MIHDQKSFGFATKGSFSVGEVGVRSGRPDQDLLPPSAAAGAEVDAFEIAASDRDFCVSQTEGDGMAYCPDAKFGEQ